MTREEFVRKNSWVLGVIRDRCGLTQAEKDYLTHAIEYLEQEPCEDCVSRAEALKNLALTNNKDDVYRMLTRLSPVTPIQKMGHWIHFAWSDDCSECGWSTGKYGSPTKFCPNCGAKMQEVDE